MTFDIKTKWAALAGALLLAAIVAATLVRADWQIRLGLHWLIEHFLAYFALMAIICLAWPRPMAVAALLVPCAVTLEALQGFTPDRVPDIPTALSAPPTRCGRSTLRAQHQCKTRRRSTSMGATPISCAS